MFVRGAGFCKLQVEIHERQFVLNYDFQSPKVVEVNTSSIQEIETTHRPSNKDIEQIQDSTRTFFREQKIECLFI